jgi:glutathione-regulated potassium-efflux system ancillary protein KefC
VEPAYLLVPFLGGLAAMTLRLPPLVGFLAAGFALNAMGYEVTPELRTIADLGVTLLLFTIGLKLNIRTLLRGEVWGAATIHMAASTGFFVVSLAILKFAGLSMLHDAGWSTFALLAFALSFSSTVFAVKVLEERSESKSLYGRIAVGVLIMQDIFAVVFLTASTGDLPSPWAVGLLLLIPAAPLLHRLLVRVGHGEMQILFGVVLALVVGYALFEQVGVKGDLGALIVGMLLAPHPAANGLSKALFNLKELFLVGFFVSIGLTALPTVETVGVALLLMVVLPVKSVLFMMIFSGFRLRHRTSFLASLSLTNFSEFGLIVAALAAGQGWLEDEWLVALSVAVAVSFAAAALLNSRSSPLFWRARQRLPEQDAATLHPADRPIDLGHATTVVMGMGHIGRGAYDRFAKHYGVEVLGIEADDAKAAQLRTDGYTVVEGDAADSDFWERLELSDRIQHVILAMPHHSGNFVALEQLRGRSFAGRITAVVSHLDEVEPLHRRGAHAVFHVYDEAGVAVADSAMRAADNQPPTS